jgi:organic radical activating enzyme
MQYFNLTTAQDYKLKSMPRGKDSLTNITNTCNIPNKTITVDFNSDCFICGCDGWLPISVGKVKDFDSFDQLLNSPIAKILRQDIQNKKFTWCAVDHCGIKNYNIDRARYELLINIDESCNLHCPSCRREQIMHIDGPEVESKQQDVNRIITWLEKFNEPIQIVLSGNGDPLASTIIRPLIKFYKPKSTQFFKLFTNGLLIKKQLEDSAILPNIDSFSISVDAGSGPVYETVRKGGSWKVLMENFDYLKSIKKDQLIVLNFAVQKNNYKDLDNFVKLCNKYKFNGNIHHLDDWGTWNYSEVDTPDAWTLVNGTFISNNVLGNKHPNYKECQDLVKNLQKQNFPNIAFTSRLINLLDIHE